LSQADIETLIEDKFKTLIKFYTTGKRKDLVEKARSLDALL
jgi:hypothetical protein